MRFHPLLVALLPSASIGFVSRIPQQSFGTTTITSTNLYESAPAPSKTDIEILPIEKLPDSYNEMRKKTLTALHQSGKLPTHMEEPLSHFLTEYFVACSQSSTMTAESTAQRFMQAITLGMKHGMGDNTFQFSSAHMALRGGEENNPEGDFDFYKFGCDFFKPAMDLEKSVVFGNDNLKQAFERAANGENVVFLANHQSEADPQVVSALLEENGYGEEAARIVYVAGHKVTTDALAIPFSMGRNLLCIHSKRHIMVEPELKSKKTQQNLQTMGAMTEKLKKGGAILWVAPSGGRDRRDLETMKVPVAPFDQKTIDLFRLLGNKSKKPTHFYPMALVSYDLCPPPDVIESSVGEKRNVRFTPVGMAVSEEVPNIGGVESRHLFTEHAEAECIRDYEKLLHMIENE